MKAIGSSPFTATLVVLTAVLSAACGPEEVPQPTASTLAFEGTPASAIAGTAVGPFQVTVLDQDGEIYAPSRTVTLNLTRGDDPVPFFAVEAETENGVATFEGIVLNEAGDGFAFVARSGSLAAVQSDAFEVVAAGPATLELEGPATAQVGQALSFTVSARDAFGNPAALPEGNIAVETSRNATATVDDRVAERAKVSVAFLEPGASWLTVVAGNPKITATSRVQVALAGDIASLALRLPEQGTAGDEDLQAELVAYDSHGNVATTFVGDVVFTSSEPTDLLPQQVGFTNDSAGRLVVDGFLFTAAGARTLSAQVGDVTQSASISVVPGPVAELQVTGSGTAVTAGTTVDFSIQAHDEFGNPATQSSGVIIVESSYPGFAPRSLPLEADGTVSFHYPFLQAGTFSVNAFHGTHAEVRRDSTLIVRPAAPAHFRVTPKGTSSNPAGPIVAGEDETLTVRVVDAHENRVTNYAGEISLIGDGIAIDPVAEFTTSSGGEISVDLSGRTAPLGSVEISDPAGQIASVVVTYSVKPASAVSLEAEVARTSLTPFESEDVTVTAFDPFGNVATGIDHAVAFRLYSPSFPDSPEWNFDTRFRDTDAGILTAEKLVSGTHEGSFTLDITSDDGLSTSIDFEVTPVELDVQTTWSSDVAGSRAVLQVTAPLTIPVPIAGYARFTLPADLDLTWATVTPVQGFLSPIVDIAGNTITVQVSAYDDDILFVPAPAIELVIDDVRHSTAEGPTGDVALSLETSFGARLALGSGGSKNLSPNTLEVVALGPLADGLTTSAVDREIALSGLTAGRAYAFAVLESGERAANLECTGPSTPSWLEVHDNRLVMELPPFGAIDKTVSCSTLAGALTVNIEADTDDFGIVTHLVGNDSLVSPAHFSGNVASDDGRWVPMAWQGERGGPVTGVFDAHKGYIVPFPETYGRYSESLSVATRAPIAAAVVKAGDNPQIHHDQIVVFDLLTGNTVIVSHGPSIPTGNDHSSAPVLSPSGRYILYFTSATNLGLGLTSPTYVLQDLQNDTRRAVEIPAGLEAPPRVQLLNFSPDESEFTFVAREPRTTNNVLLVGKVDDEDNLETREIYRGTDFASARFTRNDGRILLISDVGTSVLVEADGTNPIPICDAVQLGSCRALDSTPEGWITAFGLDHSSLFNSASANPETGERFLHGKDNDKERSFFAYTSPRGHLFGFDLLDLPLGTSPARYEFAFRNRRTLETVSTVGIAGGRTTPSASRTVVSTPNDALLVFDLQESEYTYSVWAREAGGIARRVVPGYQPVVDSTGSFIASVDPSHRKIFVTDLSTGETQEVLDGNPTWVGWDVTELLAISPGGRWVTFRTFDDLWVLDTQTREFQQRDPANPPADTPDEGQGYVAYSNEDSFLVRVNPKTLGEKSLGVVPNLNAVRFFQYALTPDGKYAAYLAAVSSSPDFGTGFGVFVEEVGTNNVVRVNLLKGTGLPVGNLDTDQPIGISANGAYVSFVADGDLYIASRVFEEAVPLPTNFSSPPLVTSFSGNGNQVYVAITAPHGGLTEADEHVYTFRNPLVSGH